MQRKIALIALCGTFAAGCGAFAGKPQRFTSAAGKFSVDMPGTPQHKEQSVPTAVGPVKAYTVLGEDRKQAAYGVTYADYPPSMVNPGNVNNILEGACTGTVTSMGGTLLEKQDIALDGHPGKEIRFDVPPRGSSPTPFSCVARMYLVGNRFYQLLAASPASKFDPTEAKSYFNSFRLEGGTAPPVVANPALPPEAGPGASTASTAPPAYPGEGTAPGVPALAARPANWGTQQDPDHDCQIQVNSAVATIEVPGTIHTLETAPGRTNSPRIMTPVDGDFVAEVKVLGEDLPADPPAPSARLPFHGAGLVLWGDAGNFIRFERASFVRGGQVRRYVLFEHHMQGAPPRGAEAEYPGGPLFLRLERKGTQVAGSLSADGQNWHMLRSKDFTAPSTSVGVGAINTCAAPFRVQFEGFKLGKP